MSKDPDRIRRAFENFRHRYKWTGTLAETQANPLAAAMLRALANSMHDSKPKVAENTAASSGAAVDASEPVAMASFTPIAHARASIVDRKRLAANDRDD